MWMLVRRRWTMLMVFDVEHVVGGDRSTRVSLGDYTVTYNVSDAATRSSGRG